MYREFFRDYSRRLCRTMAYFDWAPVEKLARTMSFAWQEGRHLYICGNGGSAANAMHLANDYLYGNVFATFGGLRPGQFFLVPYGRELRPVSPLVLKVKYLIERGLQKVLAPLGKLTARRLTSRCGLY